MYRIKPYYGISNNNIWQKQKVPQYCILKIDTKMKLKNTSQKVAFLWIISIHKSYFQKLHWIKYLGAALVTSDCYKISKDCNFYVVSPD